MTTKHVYQAINRITAIMAAEGLPKSRENRQQGYSFRGIDDVYAALSRHFANEKLCMFPRVLSRTVTERATKNGGISSYVVVDVEFDFVSAIDDSTHTVRTMGEAMDTADKATNKAMSAAQKYACLQTFLIPTEGDNDADAHHYERAAPAAPKSEPSATEQAIADMFATAKTAADVAAAEAAAAKAIGDKRVVNGGRERLLKARAAAVARLEAR